MGISAAQFHRRENLNIPLTRVAIICLYNFCVIGNDIQGKNLINTLFLVYFAVFHENNPVEVTSMPFLVGNHDDGLVEILV